MDLAQLAKAGTILATRDGTHLFRVKQVHNMLDKSVQLVMCYPEQNRKIKVDFLEKYRLATREECLRANLPYMDPPQIPAAFKSGT